MPHCELENRIPPLLPLTATAQHASLLETEEESSVTPVIACAYEMVSRNRIPSHTSSMNERNRESERKCLPVREREREKVW